MRPGPSRRGWSAALLAAAGLVALAAWRWPGPSASTGAAATGLFTTLPILWGEAPDLKRQLADPTPPHWARAVLAGGGRLEPFDALAGPGGAIPPQLARLDQLVIAQPRPLSPAENLALDSWVRGGGRLLLLADPALTAPSAFALGDPRRPQGTVLLSPILHHWGLELTYDPGQRFGETRRLVGALPIPLNLPGGWRIGEVARCALWGGGVGVTCRIGRGRLVALADAALLDRDDADGARAAALAALRRAAFARVPAPGFGETAGQTSTRVAPGR